jgi:quinol-cytochrome oxidoreductase complex cytochrome b subunit
MAEAFMGYLLRTQMSYWGASHREPVCPFSSSVLTWPADSR